MGGEGGRTAVYSCGQDSTCGGQVAPVGAVTDRGQVTVYRSGVDPEAWTAELVVSGPEIVDREAQTWGETFTPNPANAMEAAIFVLGHEEWHVKNPPTKVLRKDEEIMDEANAHNSGKKALERWRNRKKP